jgi:hypothetical protein
MSPGAAGGLVTTAEQNAVTPANGEFLPGSEDAQSQTDGNPRRVRTLPETMGQIGERL